MVKVVKLRRGLRLSLAGSATGTSEPLARSQRYALCPDSFEGMTPRLLVKEGDRVLAGDALFCNKHYPDVLFSSPVSGEVEAVVRGERRKVLAVVVKADNEDSYRDFGSADVTNLMGDEVVERLLKAGILGYFNQLPYAISTNASVRPKGIFVTALRDKPLAADFDVELNGQEEDFKTGLTALSKIAPTYLGIGPKQPSWLQELTDVTVTVFDGPCPAGNVGVQVNHLSPVNKGELVWTADAWLAIVIGRLFRAGRVDLRRLLALSGDKVDAPVYKEVTVGAPLADILQGHVDTAAVTEGRYRLIDGNVLTGRKASIDGYLGAHSSEVTVIEEGASTDELLGWIAPRCSDYSVNRSYFTWLLGKNHQYHLDARLKGGRRQMIMSGEYDRVLPMDIYGEYLIKAILASDIDKMEQLGIYEVSPEDFALAEFVDSSKLPLQQIVRNGLDMLRKEND